MENKIEYSKPVPPFVRFCAANIPMVFDDSLSYYEALCALWKWLQTDVIDVINNNAAVTQLWREELTTFETDITDKFDALSDKFDELKTYVDTYFDNLDVQDEINNKLDQMAEDGTLQEIITTYIQSNVAWTFNTVADMQNSTNLVNGSYARTLGYYSANDSGGALYMITDTGTPDGGSCIAVGLLYAHLIVTDNMINVRQYGAYGDNTHDDTTAIQNALDSGYDVFIPNGEYIVSSTLNMPFNITLKGENRADTKLVSTVENDYTIKYGASYDYNGYSGIIENIRIQSPNTALLKPYGVYLNSGITIRNCTFYSISRAIYRSSSYIDQLTIDNVYVGYCIPNNNYVINLSGNADGMKINQLKLAPYEEDTTEYNSVYISGSHGGEITNSIINCNLILNNLSAFSINNYHNEGTGSYISVKDSYVTFNNMFKYKNDSTAGTDFVLTTTSSNDGMTIILNNCVFAKNSANYETVFADEFSALPNNCTLNLNNVCRLINTADAGSTSHITTGVFITGNSQFNDKSGTYSKHSIVTPQKVIAEPYYSVRSTSSSMGTIAKFSYEKWKAGAESNLYYKILTFCDDERKVITSYSSESSISNISENGDAVAISMNKDIFAQDMLVFRGTTTGSYTSYAHVPAYARLRLIDNGLCIDGCAWNTVTATNALENYNSVRKYVKIDDNVIVYNNTTPTLGTWKEGDVVINSNRNSGQVISWVYNGSTWVSQGTYA